MRWILAALAAVVLSSCGPNASSPDPAVNARTKYFQTASLLEKINNTVSDAVARGQIRPRSDTALAIDKARGTVRAAMDVWGRNPDSIPYMNAALAALPELIGLVEQATGKKLSFLEPRSTTWALSLPSFNWSRSGWTCSTAATA